MNPEIYKDPFESYRPNLFPRLSRLGAAVGHFFTQRHEIPNTGGAPFLDQALEDEVIDLREPGVVGSVEIPESTQLMLDYWTLEK